MMFAFLSEIETRFEFLFQSKQIISNQDYEMKRVFIKAVIIRVLSMRARKNCSWAGDGSMIIEFENKKWEIEKSLSLCVKIKKEGNFILEIVDPNPSQEPHFSSNFVPIEWKAFVNDSFIFSFWVFFCVLEIWNWKLKLEHWGKLLKSGGNVFILSPSSKSFFSRKEKQLTTIRWEIFFWNPSQYPPEKKKMTTLESGEKFPVSAWLQVGNEEESKWYLKKVE